MLLADLEHRQGALHRAIATGGEARQRYVLLGDLAGELAALRLIGVSWVRLGDILRARAVFSLGAELAHNGGNAELEAVALCNGAMTWGEANDAQACTDLTAEALVLLRQVGDVRRICTGLANLAEGLTRLGRTDEAEVAAEEGVRLAVGLGDHQMEAIFLAGRGERAAIAGRHAEGEQDIRTARARLLAAGHVYDVGQVTVLLVEALRLAGQLELAITECRSALDDLHGSSFHGLHIALLDKLSVLYESSGQTALALETLRERLRRTHGFEQNPARILAYGVEERQRSQFAREGSRREESQRNALVAANRELTAALARERRERVVLQAEAVTDPLTGALNRRGFMELAMISVGNAQRAGDGLAVAVLDLDHFKRVNDTHGHRAGDVVLREVASVSAGCLRGHDLFGRFGGEEFVALIAHAEADVARLVAERIRKKLAGLVIHAQNARISCTVSIGLALFAPGMTIDQLIEAADEALYAAKRDGRDRVVLHG